MPVRAFVNAFDPLRMTMRRALALSGMLLISMLASLFLFAPTTQALYAQGDGVMIYGEGTVTTPRYRSYSSNTLGSEQTGATAAATIRHTVIKAAPSAGGRNEMLAGIQTTTGVLYIQRWNGTSWSNEWNVTVGDSNLPRFDIAYESTGRAVVVYSGNTTTAGQQLKYRTWDGSSWSAATNKGTTQTAGTVDAVKMASGKAGNTNSLAVAWADNLWDMSADAWDTSLNSGAGGWRGVEPAAAFTTNLSRTGAPAACTGTATCMTNWSFDVAFYGGSRASNPLVVWGTEGVSDPTFSELGGGNTWGNVAGTAAVEEATDIELVPDPSSNLIAYTNITGESTATAASPDLEMGMYNGDTGTYGNNDNTDQTGGLVETGTHNVSGAWVTSGANRRFVLVYDDAAAAVNWYSFNPTGSTWTAGTDFTTAPAPAAAQNVLRMRANPFNASQAMLVIVDANSDAFLKKVSFDGTNLTWSSEEPGGVAPELTVSSITGMSADYAYYSYIPSPAYDQSGYRWFAQGTAPDVGAPLAALNTVATAPAQGTPFRLRSTMHISNNDLVSSNQFFKLQYAAKGAGTCAAPTGTYTNVGEASATATVGTAVNDATVGSTAWTIPAGSLSAQDGNIAQADGQGGLFSPTNSNYLKTTNYGFSVPGGATITGIKAEAFVDSGVQLGGDQSIKIVKGGVIGGTEKKNATLWAGAYKAWGGSNDLWGQTWTPADINSSTFGVAIAGTSATNWTNLDVDHVRITVYYTSPTAIGYYDDTPANGTTLTNNANDPGHGADTVTSQVYVDTATSAGFTNSVANVVMGADGMWDFSLVDNSAPAATTYCFRYAKVDGTPLDTYSQYPEITTSSGAPTTDQLMRHGNYFSSGAEQKFWWADLGL